MNRRRIHIIAASLIFGILLWISAVMRDQFQTTVSVPLSIDDIPEGWAVRTPVPRVLHLRVRGDGWQLALLTLGSHPRLDIPFASLPASHRAISYNDVLDRLALRPGLQLVDVQPESVYVSLDRYIEKKVPLVLDLAASFRQDYGQVGETAIVPESVTVGGAESVVSSIQSWKTERTVFGNLTGSVDAEVPLAPSSTYLLTISPPSARVRIQVDLFAEKEFSGLPIELHSVPANQEVILLPPRIDVVVRAGIRQLSSLASDDLHAAVQYSAIARDTTGMVKPEVASPAGVQVVSRQPEQLHYVIRKRL